LDALLIELSPRYVEAMGEELNKRFEGFRRYDDNDDGEEDDT